MQMREIASYNLIVDCLSRLDVVKLGYCNFTVRWIKLIISLGDKPGTEISMLKDLNSYAVNMLEMVNPDMPDIVLYDIMATLTKALSEFHSIGEKR